MVAKYYITFMSQIIYYITFRQKKKKKITLHLEDGLEDGLGEKGFEL